VGMVELIDRERGLLFSLHVSKSMPTQSRGHGTLDWFS
jgi:hypothetical protein